MLTFKGATNQLFGGFFADNQQHDADEFVARLVGALEDEANRGRRSLLGSSAGSLAEIRVLNRVIRLMSDGIRYEADPRHAEILSAMLDFSFDPRCAPF